MMTTMMPAEMTTFPPGAYGPSSQPRDPTAQAALHQVWLDRLSTLHPKKRMTKRMTKKVTTMLPLVAHGGQTDQAYDIKGVDGAKLLVDVALRSFDRHHPGLEEAPVRVAFLYLGACPLYQGGGRLAEAPEGVTPRVLADEHCNDP